MRAPRRPSVALLALAAAACAAPERRGPEAVRAPAALVEVALIQEARHDPEGRLASLLASGDEELRVRAATALGRLPAWRHGEEVERALGRALADPAPEVRAAAAFALGMRGQPRAAEPLLAHRDEPDPQVRARLVEAAGRVATPALRAWVLAALGDPAAQVRAAAATTPHRWPMDAADAAGVDAALAGFVLAAAPSEDRAPGGGGPAREAGGPSVATSTPSIGGATSTPSIGGAASTPSIGEDGESGGASRASESVEEAVWRALFTLQRRRAEAGRAAMLRFVGDERSAEARLFAVAGLASLEPEAASLAALERAAGDPDWRVACEALRGLGALADAAVLPALERAFERSSHHVRLCAVEAAGRIGAGSASAARLVERAGSDPSTAVRAAGLEALARIDGAQPDTAFLLASAGLAHEPVLRIGAARALRHLPAESAVPTLVALTHDQHPGVAGAAAAALGAHPPGPASADGASRPRAAAADGASRHARDEGRARLLELAAGPDDGLRLAALGALIEAGEGELAPFRDAFERSPGEAGSELRFQALRGAGAIGSQAALDWVAGALDDPHPYVRAVAASVLAEHGIAGRAVAGDDDHGAGAEHVAAWAAPAGQRPLLEVVTFRGTLVFELFPDEAPAHVHNLLVLARSGHYEGLDFHRVVPDFVVQGGCHRGDGNGARTWHGAALRHEIGPRAFVRGSLGMPRNEYLESGGSQIFVTHRPTPHLEGGYTILGELREGGEVLDELQQGDRILELRVRAGGHGS